VGYDRARDLATFRLELEHYPGLVLRVRRPGFAGERAVRKAWPVLTDVEVGRAQQEPALALAAGALAGALVSWTLELDGEPVPCTSRAVLALDTPFLLELVTTWVERIVLRPLAQPAVEDASEDDEPEPDVDPDPGRPDGAYGEDGDLDEEWLAQLPTVPEPAGVTAVEPEGVTVDA